MVTVDQEQELHFPIAELSKSYSSWNKLTEVVSQRYLPLTPVLLIHWSENWCGGGCLLEH